MSAKFEINKQVQNWSPKEVIVWLKTQLKPEYKNEKIEYQKRSTEDFYCKGWLLAYRSSGTIWVWRGNYTLINSVTEQEKQKGHWSEYYTLP